MAGTNLGARHVTVCLGNDRAVVPKQCVSQFTTTDAQSSSQNKESDFSDALCWAHLAYVRPHRTMIDQ